MLLHHDWFTSACGLFPLKGSKENGSCHATGTPEGKCKCPQIPREEAGIQFWMKWSQHMNAAVKPAQNTWASLSEDSEK